MAPPLAVDPCDGRQRLSEGEYGPEFRAPENTQLTNATSVA